MSLVEKAGANILKTSFDKKDKKKKKDKFNEVAAEISLAPSEPETLNLNFARLAEMGFYNPEDRSSQLALELRAVKRRLLRRIGYLRSSGERQAFRTPGKQRNLILVTSTRAGEGKTFTAINLALSLAMEDKIETLLVDADLSRPKIRERLDLAPAPGVYDRIMNADLDPDMMGWRLEEAPLSILPEGARAERPTDLFATASAQQMWTDIAMADPQRLVIIDAPPVLAATDAVMLAKYADEILFVVEANSTPEPAVAAAVDELIDVNPNVSLMLNRCQIGAGGAHYGSYEYYDRSETPTAPAAANRSNEG
jgi:Mrp family chromosome partitioning ATPase